MSCSPYNLIISQRPHLQIPSRWGLGFNIRIWGRHKTIASKVIAVEIESYLMNWIWGIWVSETLWVNPRVSAEVTGLMVLVVYFSVVSNSLRPHGLQHARLPCPSPSPGTCSNSCPLSQWCHPTIFSSVVPFSSCLQSFPASGSFLLSWLFTSGGQSIGASVSASVLLMNIKDWFPLGLTALILQSKGLSRVFSTSQFKSINSSALSLLYGTTLTSIHDNWKNHSFDYTELYWQSNVSTL